MSLPSSARPIVVVDDNDDDLELTLMLLRKVAGVSRFLPFSSGDEAVAFLRQVEPAHDDFPRAIVLDVKMPGMTGLELLEWIREHPVCDEVAVTMWSSSDLPSDVARAAALGAQCYITKYPPVHVVDELFRVLNGFENCRATPVFAFADNRLRGVVNRPA